MSYSDEIMEPEAWSDFATLFFFEKKSLADLMLGPIGEVPRRPVVTVSADVMVAEAIRAMNEAEVGHVIAVRDGRMVGIFTERDLLRNATSIDPSAVAVEGVMTPDPEALSPATPVGVALRRMAIGDFRQLPVIDEEGGLEGVVTVRDLVVWLTCSVGT